MKSIVTILDQLTPEEVVTFNNARKEYLSNMFYPSDTYPDVPWVDIDFEDFHNYLVQQALNGKWNFSNIFGPVLFRLLEPGDDIAFRLNRDMDTSFSQTSVTIKKDSYCLGMVSHVDEGIRVISVYYSFFELVGIGYQDILLSRVVPGSSYKLDAYRNGVNQLLLSHQDDSTSSVAYRSMYTMSSSLDSIEAQPEWAYGGDVVEGMF